MGPPSAAALGAGPWPGSDPAPRQAVTAANVTLDHPGSCAALLRPAKSLKRLLLALSAKIRAEAALAGKAFDNEARHAQLVPTQGLSL